MKSPVLMAAYLYPPDNASGAIRAGRFGRYLQKLGHPVTVIGGAAENVGKVSENIHRLRGEFGFEQRRDVSGLVEMAVHKFLLPSDWSYAWGWRAAAYAGRFMRSDSRPVVVTSFPPLSSHWVGLWLKKRYGVGWVADFRDPLWGDPFRVARGREEIDRWMEGTIFRHADHVIAVTDVQVEEWNGKYPQWRDKTHLIWNGYDSEEGLGPLPLPPRGYKVIAHVGSIYGPRHPGPVLASVARLAGRGLLAPDRLKIRLVGSLAYEQLRCRELLDTLAASGFVEVTPEMPRPDAQRVMATSDYLMLLDMLLDVPSVYATAKIFEYLQVGRPVLLCTVRNSVAERVVARSGVPYRCLFKEDSDDEADRKLLDFLALPSEPAPLRPEFAATFSAMPQAVYLSSLIEAAAGKRPAPCSGAGG